jgi:iron(II)-dependent oxidoreductase
MLRNYAKTMLSLIIAILILSNTADSQNISNVGITVKNGLSAENILLPDSSLISFGKPRPLFTFLLNDKLYNSEESEAVKSDNQYTQVFSSYLHTAIRTQVSPSTGWTAEITFENRGNDTVSISNIVPFGEEGSSVYITGKGPWDLARAYLFRPGLRPVRVILPDNAWELGYSSFETEKGYSVCALARRTGNEGGQKQRYETKLPPQSKIIYTVYADLFRGEWQNGLRLMFRDRHIYDVDKFDDSMFKRADLAWIRESYLIILQMAWDREFYDRFTGKYTFPEVLKNGNKQFGKIDVFGIWPTWPRLGLDERNQWDLYRDLPGGLQQLRNFRQLAAQSGTKFFIAYNPWDNSTRKEDHLKGMARLISETDADGVVLDTRGSSSYALQAAADSIKKGVVMYSEGMAITKDMPGIIAGRVHNAIYLSPELNLNKLIKPDFSIFRVCDVGEDLVHREVAISFFNGYGTELNMFRPGGRNDDFRSDMDFLSRTTFILRQNNDAFLDNDWTPMIETRHDSVFVNRWRSGGKTIYTILNMNPAGIDGALINAVRPEGKHFVSLWNHENLEPLTINGLSCLPAKASGWRASWSGTRREGSVDCIAELPELIRSELKGDSIKLKGTGKGTIVFWKGDPSYNTVKKEFLNLSDTIVRVKDLFGIYEGKIVLQLLEDGMLRDEDILYARGGKPWIMNKPSVTEKASIVPETMVLVPGSELTLNLTPADEFIPYPDLSGRTVKIDSFLIDKYPVTNADYYEFIVSSGYIPADTTRFLCHWQSGKFRQGQDKYPVVNVGYEDMAAYARWAKKRLPTQAEWQLAAQGKDNRLWPWGNEFHATFCNNSFGRPTPVDAFLKGLSPCGAADMVGNVWQMTSEIWFNGSNYFGIIRGGSYYKPESSWWYIQGGPQQLDKTQIILLVSPGFDRSSTVGFRCVKDIDQNKFKERR